MNYRVEIHDAKPSKKNPHAKYKVRSVGKNNEVIQSSESLNDEKAVRTNIKAMTEIYSLCPKDDILNIAITDCTKARKFTKGKNAIAK
jgi:hypothetical protein